MVPVSLWTYLQHGLKGILQQYDMYLMIARN